MATRPLRNSKRIAAQREKENKKALVIVSALAVAGVTLAFVMKGKEVSLTLRANPAGPNIS